ncbi:hypothetical protein N9W89_08725 [Hellea sp.]|nr:hypothetical protein [Hellea sp.]
MSNLDESFKLVLNYIEKERKSLKITKIDRKRKREISGISQGMNGEIRSLLDTQLLTTEVGYGAWDELDDEDIMAEVLMEIEARSK